MRHKLLFLLCLLSCKAFAQNQKGNSNLQIDHIVENRYAVISYGYERNGVFIYDMTENKLINYFSNSGSPHLAKDKKRLFVFDPNYTIDIKTGKIISNKIKLDTISFANLFDANSKLKLTFDDYVDLQVKDTNLKVVTETLEEIYNQPRVDYHSSAGSPPYNNDNRNPEAEQIRFNYPYLIDTLRNDSFGVFDLKKQLYFNTHKIPNYKLKSANISPNQTFYYATFKKQDNVKIYHYLFNISNNKYLNLNNYDTSKCSEDDIHRVSFSNNDSFFATINTCEKAIIYKVGNDLKQYYINKANELIARIEFSPKSKYFITYSVYENDTASFYKYFSTYDSAGHLYYSTTKYTMDRLQKPLYYVKVWNCKTMKPILDFRTSSIKFGFSEDDNFLAIKNENIMVQTFFGSPRDNYSFYKDTVYNPYLSIIDLNRKKEIKQLNIFDKYDIKLEYIWNRQKRPYFIFSADNKKIITNQNENYPKMGEIIFDDIYEISNGSSLLKKLNGKKNSYTQH